MHDEQTSIDLAKAASSSTEPASNTTDALLWVDRMTALLDTKFAIPGTRVRFGVDFLLGLIPGIGDATSLSMSGVLIATMARHGASPRLIVRMLMNVFVDAVIGTIPFLGNIFDLFFKANQRNLILMRQYHHSGMHRGSVWPIIVGVVVSIFLMIGLGIGSVIVVVGWLLPHR